MKLILSLTVLVLFASSVFSFRLNIQNTDTIKIDEIAEGFQEHEKSKSKLSEEVEQFRSNLFDLIQTEVENNATNLLEIMEKKID